MVYHLLYHLLIKGTLLVGGFSYAQKGLKINAFVVFTYIVDTFFRLEIPACLTSGQLFPYAVTEQFREICGIVFFGHWSAPPCECLDIIHSSGVPMALPLVFKLRTSVYSIHVKYKDFPSDRFITILEYIRYRTIHILCPDSINRSHKKKSPRIKMCEPSPIKISVSRRGVTL